jgi:predicted amidohydrolase YtcJ
MRLPLTALLTVAALVGPKPNVATAAEAPADRIYQHGVVFTADSQHPSASAIAIRAGRIVYVGDDAGVVAFAGPETATVDLEGRFVMPGLVDGHMHPLDAGRVLLKCSLNYDALTVPEFQKRVQACIDASAAQEPDGWLEIVDWFQESMLPAGTKTNRTMLDGLKTKRPVLIRSSFGHTTLANTRALTLAKLTAKTPDPAGGKIWRDANGEPTGLLEDGAQDVFDKLLPASTPAADETAAAAALEAMRAQGITSFLDAAAPVESIVAFTALQKAGRLTARGHFAPVIEPAEAAHPEAAVARVSALVKQYDQGAADAAPGITVRNVKLFMDGVISAPALTGNMAEPYRMNAGSADKPNWVAGTDHGPAVYFPAAPLAAILTGLARAGINPHLHCDGDGAVHAAIDGFEAMRKAVPGADIRPAIAHAEIVLRADYPRLKAVGAIPVLSFQWEKPAGDTLGVKDYFGPERMKLIEPAGFLADAGVRIAFGSDWPVDRLDEWFAIKVAVTRTNRPDSLPEYHGRLGEDHGLSRKAALRAATLGAAYELHADLLTGSLSPGKAADLIVLDRNVLTVPAEDIAKTRVLETMVGGVVVYTAD